MKILDKSGHFRASTAGMVVFRSNAPGLGSPKAQNFCCAKVHAMQTLVQVYLLGSAIAL